MTGCNKTFPCVVLIERLQMLEHEGGMSILKEYVHPYRAAKSTAAVQRYEMPTGCRWIGEFVSNWF